MAWIDGSEVGCLSLLLQAFDLVCKLGIFVSRNRTHGFRCSFRFPIQATQKQKALSLYHPITRAPGRQPASGAPLLEPGVGHLRRLQREGLELLALPPGLQGAARLGTHGRGTRGTRGERAAMGVDPLLQLRAKLNTQLCGLKGAKTRKQKEKAEKPEMAGNNKDGEAQRGWPWLVLSRLVGCVWIVALAFLPLRPLDVSSFAACRQETTQQKLKLQNKQAQGTKKGTNKAL